VSAVPLTRAPQPVAQPRRRHRERRHLRVVTEQPRRHPVVFLGLYLVIATGIVLGAVSLNALAAGGAVEARELSRAVAEAERSHGLLVADVAGLEDPVCIQQAAREAGLVPATSPRFLSPGRVLPVDMAPSDPADDDIKPLLSADGR
jgi:hypothetical protein